MIKTDEERVKALFKELVEFYKKNRYLFPKEDGVIKMKIFELLVGMDRIFQNKYKG